MLYFLSAGVAPQYGMPPPVDKPGKKKERMRVILSADSKGEGNMYMDTACSRECNFAVQATLQTHQKRARAHTNKTKPLPLSLSRFVS